MLNFFILLFILTLLYATKAEIIRHYIFILGLQGVILFVVAILALKDLDPLHLIFILSETLFFKAFFVPVFLKRLAKRTKLKRNYKGLFSGTASVFVGMIIIAISFSISHVLHDEHLEIKYFTAAISAIGIGFYIAINHKYIISHLISFLILENGIFLLSLSLGGEMPMFVNTAILMDIFTTVLIMGVFFRKVGEYFDEIHSDKLSQLKD